VSDPERAKSLPRGADHGSVAAWASRRAGT
jgi:hypothetical protein